MPDTPRLIATVKTTMTRFLGPDVGYTTGQEAILATLDILESREAYGPMLFAAWTSRLVDQIADTAQRLDLGSIAPGLDAELRRLRAEILASQPHEVVA